MAYVFVFLEADADQNWPNRDQNAPRGSKNEIKIAHGASKMKLETPNRAQRSPEEAKGDLRGSQRRFWEGQGGPQSAKMCSQGSQDAPRERQGDPKGGLRGATWPPRWDKRAQRRVQQVNK